MSSAIGKRRRLVGGAVGLGAMLALVAVLGVFAGAGAAAIPANTSSPTLKGMPQEGQRLTGARGKWSDRPTDYNYFWTRCDTTGSNCADISGATGATYTLVAPDVGSSLRFKVQAKNRDGSTFSSSVPTAVVVAAVMPAPTPSATGCPPGSGVVQIAALTPPARLLIDQQQSTPAVVLRGTRQLTLRYHVSACGQSVQGALLYVAVVPFNALSIPLEQATDQNGWAVLNLSMLPGFPVGSRQQLVTIFVRARKSGENLLAGVSTRRLFSVRVDLTR